ncbi:MAG: hypothetical protein WCS52_05005 [bacterium]
MESKISSIRGVIAAFGFEKERIDRALAALQGDPLPGHQEGVEEPLLTPIQLGKRLGVSQTSLWRMQPPFIRVGQRKRFVWNEIQEFLKATGKAVAA